MVYLMLGVPSKITRGRPLVEGATVLEMLWIGAHSRSLRKRLQAISLPSSEMLRSGGMFDINVVQDYGNDEGRRSEESLLDSGFRKVELEDSVQGIDSVFPWSLKSFMANDRTIYIRDMELRAQAGCTESDSSTHQVTSTFLVLSIARDFRTFPCRTCVHVGAPSRTQCRASVGEWSVHHRVSLVIATLLHCEFRVS